MSVDLGDVFGLPLGKNIFWQHMSLTVQMLAGKSPMVPNIAFPMVDARHVAKINVGAMTHPNAAGLRIIAARDEAMSLSSIAKRLKGHGYKGPSSRIAPSFPLKIVSAFDREPQGMKG